jgi:GTP pyrophosphokinase
MQPSKQYKIAGETLYIYAPIASRLGLNRIKNELEDLSFKYEHPDDYQLIQDKLASTQAERDFVFREFTTPIRTALDGLGLTYTIEARIKTPYSIWKKMQDKHVTFEEIFDILATRIIFEPKQGEDEVNTCFNIYVALTKIYTLHPDRTRDWVNHPKANGYQALHVTLMSHRGEWIEVQIRSHRMQDIAEQGVAAHWRYESQKAAISSPAKPQGDSAQTDSQTQTPTTNGVQLQDDKRGTADDKMDSWIHTIKEILDDPQPDSLDLLDTIKLNLFASEIIVFTPKGEIKTMPTGATALDFAFSIHSFLGTNCIGAKVNHRLVPPTEPLNSGDQVEILTSRTLQVKREWLDYVTTAKARSKIQACLRKIDREKQAQGERQLRDFLTNHNIEYNPTILDKLRIFHQRSTAGHFLLDVATGTIALGDDDIHMLRGRGKGEGSSSFSWRSLIPFVKKESSTGTSAAKSENTNSQTFELPNSKTPALSAIDRK